MLKAKRVTTVYCYNNFADIRKKTNLNLKMSNSRLRTIRTKILLSTSVIVMRDSL